jgi:hypothetical protein
MKEGRFTESAAGASTHDDRNVGDRHWAAGTREAQRGLSPVWVVCKSAKCGAQGRNRTTDTGIFSPRTRLAIREGNQSLERCREVAPGQDRDS